MKKITLFLICAAFISGTAIMNAQLTFGSYHITETFEGLTALPEGWAKENVGAVIDTVRNGQIDICREGNGSINGPRAFGLTFPESPEATEFVYVEMDFMVGPNLTSIMSEPQQGLHLSFGANATFHSEVIFELGFHGNSAGGKVHLQNLDLSHIQLAGTGTSNAWMRPTSEAFPNGLVVYSNFDATATTINWAVNTTYKIKAFLDFANKKVVRIYFGDNLIGENLGFVNSTATNISKLAFIAIRGGNGNANFTGTNISYFEVGSITEIPPAGISQTEAGKTIVSKMYFDILGKQVPESTKGLIIERITYEDGSQTANKFYVK